MNSQRPDRLLQHITLLTSLVFALCGTAHAAPAHDPAIAAIQPKVAELVDLISNGRVDAMLDRIGPIADDDRPKWEEARTYLINLYGNAGKCSGFDFAGFKPLTPRFYEVYVLVYFEKRPVLLDFGFYNIDNAWRPQTFHVETDFKPILDTMPLQK